MLYASALFTKNRVIVKKILRIDSRYLQTFSERLNDWLKNLFSG